MAAVQTAGFLSIIMLPWAFKLLTGPLMGLMGFLLLFAILMFRTHGHPEKILQGKAG